MVTDLFEDIKDGVILLALLEVLSGQKLVSFTLNFGPNREVFGLHFRIRPVFPLLPLVADEFTGGCGCDALHVKRALLTWESLIDRLVGYLNGIENPRLASRDHCSESHAEHRPKQVHTLRRNTS